MHVQEEMPEQYTIRLGDNTVTKPKNHQAVRRAAVGYHKNNGLECERYFK
jgi:hypothetical protein